MALRSTLIMVLAAAVLHLWLVPAESANSVRIIYSTDLFHPPDDPDDHVDLATLFALPELDIAALILDLGQQQRKGPGDIPLKQMMHLTGRKVAFATGLAHPLRHPRDTGANQFSYLQGGVNLILDSLRKSREKVYIVTTGSVRDVVAAFNRDPELFRSKVDRIYVNAGNSAGGELYWNPGLDPQAYLGLMRSDLPVYWVPCFGGKETLQDLADGKLGVLEHQSYWKFRQGDVFEPLAPPLQSFFLYALTRKNPETADPVSYLSGIPESALKEKLWKEMRNMWSTVSLYHAAGRELYRKGGAWRAARTAPDGYERKPVYDFVRASVRIDDDLRSVAEPDARGKFQLLRITDLDNYQDAMTMSLRQLLSEMPLTKPSGSGK